MAEKLNHVQTLRAISATLVIGDHASGNLIKWGALPGWFQDARFQLGGLGVSTFFVISGFIMINTSYEDFGDAGRAVVFALKRLIRIVPIYWLATLIAAVLAWRHGAAPTGSELARSLFFVPYAAQIGEPMGPILGQGWTLNYEMFFYALFTLALLLPRRLGLLSLMCAFVAIVGCGSLLKPLTQASEADSVLSFLSAPLILLFAVGMGIGVLKRKTSWRHRIAAPMLWTCAIFFLTMAATVIWRIPSAKPFLYQVVFWVPGTVACILAIYAKPGSNGWVDGFFGKIGDASYCTYLFHTFAIAAVAVVFGHFRMSPTVAIGFILSALVAGNLTGLVAHLLIERRMNRGGLEWIRRTFPIAGARAAATA